MTEDREGFTGGLNWSARKFLSEYDRKLNNKQKFEKTYIRQTYLVRRELNNRLNELCKKRPGFKTAFINFILEETLNEIDASKDGGRFQPDSGEESREQTTGTAKEELSRRVVEDLLNQELVAASLDEQTTQQIRDEVFEKLFPNGATVTSLGYHTRKGTRYKHPLGGRGKTFSSVDRCVRDYIKQRIGTTDHKGDNKRIDKDEPRSTQIGLFDQFSGDNSTED